MRAVLPFNIIGQVAPILAWVESSAVSRLPDAWWQVPRPFKERERGWVLRELPTYSYDNVQEILDGSRQDHRRFEQPADLPRSMEPRQPRLRSPEKYDLLMAFHILADHYFTWKGGELCVREGKMEELHELAMRFPVGHIVRHSHALAVARGSVTAEKAIELPEQVTLLPSNSFGVRSVIRKGLSECHLHLTAVVSAEETWAGNMLVPLRRQRARAKRGRDRRLLTLNALAGRLLALAVWWSLLPDEPDQDCQPFDPRELLVGLDRLYFASDDAEEHEACRALQQSIRRAVYGDGPFFDSHDAGQEARRSLCQRVQDEIELLRNRERPRNDEQRKAAEKRLARLERELGELDWAELQAKVWALEQAGQAVPPAMRQRVRELEQQFAPHGDGWDRAQSRSTQRRQAAAARPLVAYAVKEEYRWLSRWMARVSHYLESVAQHWELPGGVIEEPRDRFHFVQRLHLLAHQELIRRLANSDEGGKLDLRGHFLQQTLYRYLICRTHHWQQVAQQDEVAGLSHFHDYYYSPHRNLPGMSDPQYNDLVLQRLQEWRGLRVVEGRVGPPQRLNDLANWVLPYARRRGGTRVHKLGLVVHFKKEREAREENYRHSKEIDDTLLRLRWGKRRRLLRSEGQRLYRMLRRPTPVTPFVVGVDAANLELATPPEVFAPLFRFLRDRPIELTVEPRPFAPYVQVDTEIRELARLRRLGMTYHVGEDFRHLLSGLRAIDEAVRFLAPQPGDRLGHGTALALDPETWLAHNGYQAVVPRLEWLDTLVWVHHFLGPGDELVGELGLEDRIQRLSWQIYSEALGAAYDPLGLDPSRMATRATDTPAQSRNVRLRSHTERPRGLLDWDWSPLALWDAWRLRQLDPYSLDLEALLQGRLETRKQQQPCEESWRWHLAQERALGEVDRDVGSRNAYLLLGLYWLSRDVRRQGQVAEVVDMQDQRHQWRQLCQRAEQKMERKIYRRELVVEANPSSNRVIGPMANYGQHHVFNLTLDEGNRLRRGVRVSINTDNPAVCNTTLAHEYYLLAEVLTRRDVPEAEVTQWLEWLRQNGEDYCFARRLPKPEDSEAMRKVLAWLQEIRPTVIEARTREAKLAELWRWMKHSRLRDAGLDPDQPGSDPDVLLRLLAAERQLRGLRGGPDTPELARRLAELERELSALRGKVLS